MQRTVHIKPAVNPYLPRFRYTGILARVVAAFGVCIFFFAFIANAASDGFTVSPIKSFIEVKPGVVETGALLITNRSDAPLPLQATVHVFGVKDAYGTIDFEDVQGLASAENANAWLILEHPFLLLNGHETRSVAYRLAVPDGAPYGTYTLAIVMQSKFPSPEAANEAAAQLLPAIGSLFFIDVSSPAGREGEPVNLTVTEFAIPKEQTITIGAFGASMLDAISGAGIGGRFVERAPLDFTIRVKNSGRYIARPSGTVAIKTVWGSTVASTPLPEGAILPGAERVYAVTIPGPLRFYEAAWIPDVFRFSFFPGKYTASLALSAALDTESRIVNADLTYWAFPRLLTLSTVLSLILAIFMVSYRGKVLAAAKAFWQQKSKP